MEYSTQEWILFSRLANAPMVYMLQVNGLMMDIHTTPLGLQQLACVRGLVPFLQNTGKHSIKPDLEKRGG